MNVVFVLLFSLLALCQVTPPTAQYFAQYVDHFNAQDNRVFQQKYYVNDVYFQPGGPIFFQLGGESPIDGTELTSWQMSVYARQFNALQITLEHRFYGESQPLPTLDIQNLVYLSSEQALADAARFATYIKTLYPNATQVSEYACV